MLSLEPTLKVHLIQPSHPCDFIQVIYICCVLHISNHYVETKIIILHMHSLGKAVEEIGLCETTFQILKTQKALTTA